MAEKTSQANSSSNNLPNIPAVAPTSDTPYIQPVIGKLGYDTKHPEIFGLGSSPDNGASFHVWASFGGIVLDKDNMDAIWINGVSDRVKSEVNSATAEIPAVKSAADEAVKKADSAIASSKVNSDAIVAQSEAISEAKSAMASSVAEINQAIANASSNADKIRADVDQVQNEVNSAKSANESTIAQIKSDISQTKDSLTAVNDKLAQAQSAANQAQSALREQVNQLSASVTANQSAITQAQTANDNMAQRLDTYASQASEQGKTIKSVQSDVASNTTTIADVNSNVNQVQQTANSLSASLKNANSDIAVVKAQADGLSTTLSDQAKSIASVTATATQIKSSLSDATGRLSTLEQTSSSQSATLSDVQKNLNNVTATATALTNTLSNAQGDITKLQTSAKSVQTQITDLQGNYTSLKSTVDGLSTTVSSHDKSIESLQVTANGLTNSVKDAQGNIGNLQATAKTLNSSMTDAQGRLSRVEQTATSNSSTIANLSNKAMQDRGAITDPKTSFDSLNQPGTYSIKATGLTNMPEAHYGTLIVSGSNGSGWISQQFVADTSGTIYTRIFANNAWSDWKQGGTQEAINQVKQTADANTATISDAKGDINSLKQTATSLQATLTNHGNDITQIKANANNLSSRIAGVESSTNTLKDQTEWKTNYGSVDLNNFKIPCHEFLKGSVTNAPSESAWWYLTVESSDDGNRVTQTVIADQSNNRYTRRWADGWSAWVKDATQTDVTALSNRITTNSTQITQNKQAIALKADQSTVDNLTGEVSQAQAQLKVQADQISSKVSSTEYQTLKGKVDGMQIGTRNLLHNTSDEYRTLTGGGWLGQTTASSMYTSVANYHSGNWFTYAATVSNTSTKTVTLETWLFDQNKQSISVKNAEGIPVATHSQDVPPGQNSMRISTSFRITSGTWFVRTYVILKGGDAPANSKIQVKDERLVEGNVAGTWEANPDDLITSITKNATAIDQTNQKISLKADQTEVDQVKQTATQNSSRLNVMANEISSKVTSTDVNNIVNSKGYATTSTVQSLITQKAGTINENITNLDAKYSAKDGINLQRGTGDCSFPIDSYNATVTIENYDDRTKMFHVKGSCGFYTSYNADTSFVPTVGEIYTVSADVKGVGTTSGDFFKYEGADSCSLGTVTLTNNWQRISNTVHIGSVSGQWIFYLNHNAGDFYVKHIKIERGSVATPWTPAPIDNATVTQVQQITASIDGIQSAVKNKADSSTVTQLSNLVQSKVSSSDFNNLKNKIEWTENDNIDFNNCKTQMNVFTHSSMNAPNSNYWWYLQVMPGQDGKVMQYATSDRDDKHYTRQFTSSWTAWREDASESEITQLRDQINLRVTKGDLLSQVNLEAGRALFQSKKIYMDADTVVMGPNTKAFIPSAAITNVDADIINTGVLNGIEIRQLETGGRSIDIKNGNIAITSHDPYESRISFTNDGKNMKMFNALGDIEVLNQEFSLFNFTPEDTHSLNPIPFFKVTNTGQIGSGGAQLNMDHAIFDGYEWWTPSTGVTFGRTWNGVDKSSDYADIYAKSFVPHSELSAKTRIKKLDRKEALDKIMQDDMYTYQFKEDVRDGVSKRYASFIIDNVHDVAQYAEPEEFLSANGKGRDDGTQLAYLIAAVQYQQEQIEELKKKLEEK